MIIIYPSPPNSQYSPLPSPCFVFRRRTVGGKVQPRLACFLPHGAFGCFKSFHDYRVTTPKEMLGHCRHCSFSVHLAPPHHQRPTGGEPALLVQWPLPDSIRTKPSRHFGALISHDTNTRVMLWIFGINRQYMRCRRKGKKGPAPAVLETLHGHQTARDARKGVGNERVFSFTLKYHIGFCGTCIEY